MDLSSETTNLFFGLIGVCLGGLISLTSSVLITILASRQQEKRDKLTRQWQIEDAARERKRQVFTQRSKDIELYANAIHSSLEAFIKNASSILLNGKPNKESLEYFQKSVDFSTQAIHLQSAVYYLNDPQIQQDSNNLQAVMLRVGSYWHEKQLGNLQDINIEDFSIYLSNAIIEISSIKAKILKRIDELYTSI